MALKQFVFCGEVWGCSAQRNRMMLQLVCLMGTKKREANWDNLMGFRRPVWLSGEKEWFIAGSCKCCPSIHRQHTVTFPTYLLGTISSYLILPGITSDLFNGAILDFSPFLYGPHSLCSWHHLMFRLHPGFFPLLLQSLSTSGAGAIPLPCLIPTALSTW